MTKVRKISAICIGGMMRAAMQTLGFGDFTLEIGERQLRHKGREIFLRPKAFKTLVYLVERHGHLVEKNELMDQVWAGTSVTDAVLTHCISEVRQALQDDVHNPRYLKTIPRVGYKFIGEVSETISKAEKHETASRTAPASSIVVLPFVNISADSENEYFCDGLSEELINGLTQIKSLRVVAHSSAFSYKGRDTDAREIGQKLNVGSVLEGSVRKIGSRLRISVQLINAADGYHVWSEQFDRKMDDLFDIQEEISLAVLDKLNVKLSRGEKPGLVKHHTGSLEAYHLYLKGRSFWHRRYEGFLQKAMEYFQQAIEKDPLYAQAYVGLADAYTSLGIWALAPPKDVFPPAKGLIEKALEIDDMLAEAHASRAVISMFCEWDWEAAERGLRRAIELNPGYALGHLWYGHYLSIVGRFDDSIAEVKRAQDLDPLSPTVNANVGWTLYLAREYKAAMEELKKTLELDPHYGIAHLYLGILYMQQESYEEAIGSFQRALETTGGMMSWAAELMGGAYALAGKRDKAEKILRHSAAQSKRRYIPSSALMCLYSALRDDVRVFEWLAKAYDERDALLPWLNVDPAFDWLRPDSRFQDLLRRMRLQ